MPNDTQATAPAVNAGNGTGRSRTSAPGPAPAAPLKSFAELDAALLADIAGSIITDADPRPAAQQGRAGNVAPGAAAAPEPDEEPDEEATEAATPVTTPDADTESEDDPAAAEPEAPAEASEDFEAENAEELDHEAKAKGWPKSATKRLTKLLAKTDALKAQLDGAAKLREERDALQAEVESLKTNPAPAKATTTVEQKLAAEIQNREAWLDRIDASPDGRSVTLEDGTVREYEPEQLRQARRAFERDINRFDRQLEEHQRAQAQLKQQCEEAALKAHPWLKDKTHEDYQRIENVRRQFPEAARIPDFLGVLADALAYRRLQAAKTAATAKPAPKPPAPAVRAPGRTTSAPSLGSNERASRENTRAQFLKTGDRQAALDTIMDLVET